MVTSRFTPILMEVEIRLLVTQLFSATQQGTGIRPAVVIHSFQIVMATKTAQQVTKLCIQILPEITMWHSDTEPYSLIIMVSKM